MSLNDDIRRPDKFFVGGARVDAAGTSTFGVLNCAIEEPFETVGPLAMRRPRARRGGSTMRRHAYPASRTIDRPARAPCARSD